MLTGMPPLFSSKTITFFGQKTYRMYESANSKITVILPNKSQ